MATLIWRPLTLLLSWKALLLFLMSFGPVFRCRLLALRITLIRSGFSFLGRVVGWELRRKGLHHHGLHLMCVHAHVMPYHYLVGVARVIAGWSPTIQAATIHNDRAGVFRWRWLPSDWTPSAQYEWSIPVHPWKCVWVCVHL